MTIQSVAQYIEQLCREHTAVCHSDTEPHFVNLNDDRRNTALADELRYPAVYFEATDFTLAVTSSQVWRRYTCHIEVFQHVADTADYAEVERALSSSEQIITDIFARMVCDRATTSPQLKWLRCIDLSQGIKVVPLQNEQNALYGYMAEFTVPLPGCVANSIDNFKSSDNG